MARRTGPRPGCTWLIRASRRCWGRLPGVANTAGGLLAGIADRLAGVGARPRAPQGIADGHATPTYLRRHAAPGRTPPTDADRGERPPEAKRRRPRGD